MAIKIPADVSPTIKIPADVSPIRRKLAEARAHRKLAIPAPKPEPRPADRRAGQEAAPADRRAGQEAADARRKARAAEQSAAEKDIMLKELQEQLDATKKELAEKTPLAEKWSKHDHVRRERLIAKFPTEERKRVSKLDAEALELLVEARGFVDGAQTAAGGKPPTGTFKNVEELSALAKTNPEAYNKGVDDIKNGVIKMDAKGQVIG